MIKTLARIVSFIFHPTLIPTLGFILFFHSGFYFSYLSWEAERIVLMIVLFSTAVLPLLALAIMALNPKHELSFETPRQRLLPLVFSASFYYLGYVLMKRIDAFPVLQLILLASVVVQVILLLLSLKIDVSCHLAAIGGLTGALLALSFRTGTNPVWTIVLILLASGLAGWSRLLLNKNKLWQMEISYAVAFAVLYLVIYFI